MNCIPFGAFYIEESNSAICKVLAFGAAWMGESRSSSLVLEDPTFIGNLQYFVDNVSNGQ